MKHKKTVNDAVRAANRANAQSSTGPRTEKGKSTTSRNALRHGILAKRVVFSTDEERVEYETTWQRWNGYFHPIGALEEFFVEEVANTHWKLGITEGLETRELSQRQDVCDGIGGLFNGELKLPVSDWDLPVDRGWDCERIVVRAIAADDQENSNTSHGPGVLQGQVINTVRTSQNNHHQSGGHLEVQAVLGSSLDTMTRYRSALKRDLYRAIETLRTIQAERRETSPRAGHAD